MNPRPLEKYRQLEELAALLDKKLHGLRTGHARETRSEEKLRLQAVLNRRKAVKPPVSATAPPAAQNRGGADDLPSTTKGITHVDCHRDRDITPRRAFILGCA